MRSYKNSVDTGYVQASARLIQQAKQRSYAAMHLQPGNKVLDVGCGPATDTIQMALAVGQGGLVIGVDSDPAAVAEANERVAQLGLSGQIRHQQADVLTLPFQTAEFDAVRSERLLQNVENPEQALREMLRVTRPGGWVVAMDTDWGSISIDTTEVDIERRMVRFHAEHALRNGYSGRQLYRLCKRLGLTDIVIDVLPTFIATLDVARQALRLDELERGALAAGVVTPDELQRWNASLTQANAEGVFFLNGNMVLVYGLKPYPPNRDYNG